jgi:hypothetical protein
MSEKPTRRQILSAAAIAGASLGVPAPLLARSEKESNLETVEKKLAKPLTPQAKSLLEDALKGVETAASERLKTRLPENSEPCFTYHASAKGVRGQ